MTDPTPLDSRWIADNPAPVHGAGTTKNSRGRVLAVGGSRDVPGALRLTGEAALRAGAGKLRMATVASAATGLGLLVPEAAVLALEEGTDGEIARGGACDPFAKALGSCDAAVIGPGMIETQAAAALLDQVLDGLGDEASLVVDAACLCAAADRRDRFRPLAGRLVFTPHHGEMAALTGAEVDAIDADPLAAARGAAAAFGAVVVLKDCDTVIAAPDGRALHYGGGGTGLATGGSGDVLAGAIAGLLSRGADPVRAAGWGVWLHGQGGRRTATLTGPIGFLAREVPHEFPRLLPQ